MNLTERKDYKKLLDIGRPPNIKELFPNSNALIVSGKFIDRAMSKKGQSMSIAVNGRNYFVIKGSLLAAQKANSAIIIEIAKSEGGVNAYCAVNFWNMARIVDSLCNQLDITVPVAIHADHYAIKSKEDIETAKIEIPTLFEAGMTSIAIDASHMSDDKNLEANIELNPYIPKWAGLETEVGEIKGKLGLSTVNEALFLIRGLNAYDIFPDWIALNNGTTHGIEENGAGIQIGLTKEIHEALLPYKVSGAQHGTSGNDFSKLRDIASKTYTTKANVATALQMISWGLDVNEAGNAVLDKQGDFIKIKDQGVSETMWNDMLVYAKEKNLKAGNFKKLNLPFENKLSSQPKEIKERMVKRVEDFVYILLTDVFNAKDSAAAAYDEIISAGSYYPGAKAEKIENKKEWTKEKIKLKASMLDSDKALKGDFDD